MHRFISYYHLIFVLAMHNYNFVIVLNSHHLPGNKHR